MRRQIRNAARTVRQRQLPDAGIHRVRKQLKRARASLRLLRAAIGKSVYAAENAALRDAGRPLSGVRDARVMLQTVEGLLASEKDPACRTALLGLRRDMRRRRLQLRSELLQNAGVLKTVAESLEKSARRVAKWRFSEQGSAALYTGIERIYSRGRKALTRAAGHGSDENLHEVRKEVKYLAYSLAVFDPPARSFAAKAIAGAESIADGLGSDHDLAVLKDIVDGLHADRRAAAQPLLARIARQRKPLQAKALRQLRRVYAEKPKGFVVGLKPD